MSESMNNTNVTIMLPRSALQSTSARQYFLGVAIDAAYNGDTTTVKEIAEKVGFKVFDGFIPGNGNTNVAHAAAFSAAKSGDRELIGFLQHGAPHLFDQKDGAGQTPTDILLKKPRDYRSDFARMDLALDGI